MAAPKQFLDYVDANVEPFIERLSQAVAIPRCVLRPCWPGHEFTSTCVNSISGEPKRREDVKKMGLWLENFKLESPIGEEIMEDKKAD